MVWDSQTPFCTPSESQTHLFMGVDHTVTYWICQRPWCRAHYNNTANFCSLCRSRENTDDYRHGLFPGKKGLGDKRGPVFTQKHVRDGVTVVIDNEAHTATVKNGHGGKDEVYELMNKRSNQVTAEASVQGRLVHASESEIQLDTLPGQVLVHPVLTNRLFDVPNEEWRERLKLAKQQSFYGSETAPAVVAHAPVQPSPLPTPLEEDEEAWQLDPGALEDPGGNLADDLLLAHEEEEGLEALPDQDALLEALVNTPEGLDLEALARQTEPVLSPPRFDLEQLTQLVEEDTTPLPPSVYFPSLGRYLFVPSDFDQHTPYEHERWVNVYTNNLQLLQLGQKTTPVNFDPDYLRGQPDATATKPPPRRRKRAMQPKRTGQDRARPPKRRAAANAANRFAIEDEDEDEDEDEYEDEDEDEDEAPSPPRKTARKPAAAPKKKPAAAPKKKPAAAPKAPPPTLDGLPWASFASDRIPTYILYEELPARLIDALHDRIRSLSTNTLMKHQPTQEKFRHVYHAGGKDPTTPRFTAVHAHGDGTSVPLGTVTQTKLAALMVAAALLDPRLRSKASMQAWLAYVFAEGEEAVRVWQTTLDDQGSVPLVPDGPELTDLLADDDAGGLVADLLADEDVGVRGLTDLLADEDVAGLADLLA